MGVVWKWCLFYRALGYKDHPGAQSGWDSIGFFLEIENFVDLDRLFLDYCDLCDLLGLSLTSETREYSNFLKK